MNYGKWNNSENMIYYRYLSLYKINTINKINYRELAKVLKTRSYAQIRSHHQTEYKKILNDAQLVFDLKFSNNLLQ